MLSVSGSKANPFRYRGDVYDEEAFLYCLRSRYYDPEWGRFINADVVLGSGGLLSHNVFAYCANQPITRKDGSGMDWFSDTANWFKAGAQKNWDWFCAGTKKNWDWFCAGAKKNWDWFASGTKKNFKLVRDAAVDFGNKFWNVYKNFKVRLEVGLGLGFQGDLFGFEYGASHKYVAMIDSNPLETVIGGEVVLISVSIGTGNLGGEYVEAVRYPWITLNASGITFGGEPEIISVISNEYGVSQEAYAGFGGGVSAGFGGDNPIP